MTARYCLWQRNKAKTQPQTTFLCRDHRKPELPMPRFGKPVSQKRLLVATGSTWRRMEKETTTRKANVFALARPLIGQPHKAQDVLGK